MMRVYFWGTRGSLPASITAGAVEEKIVKAIRASRTHSLETDEAIEAFVHNELPFPVRASYGGNTACVELCGANFPSVWHRLPLRGEISRQPRKNKSARVP